jgi:hypothetical protein
MKFLVRKYYSGFCTYEIEADSGDEANEKTEEMPIDVDEIVSTLEDWEECSEVELLQ